MVGGPMHGETISIDTRREYIRFPILKDITYFMESKSETEMFHVATYRRLKFGIGDARYHLYTTESIEKTKEYLIERLEL
jgi:hypothetical protein